MNTTNHPTQKGNFDFYSAMELSHFEEFAQLTGFETGIDIDLLYPYLEGAREVAELGAGYGRAIHFLLKKGFQGEVLAVERIKRLIPLLKSRFEERITLVEQDILNLQLPRQAERIMWLWSGILELSPEEQEQSIAQVYQNLAPKGIFIIESPYRTVKVVGKLIEDRKVTLETDWGKLEAYLPTEEEIEFYAIKTGYSKFEVLRYQSTVGLERVFYFLTK